jgi:spore coat polysaccharide biosynthesis protein SpsF
MQIMTTAKTSATEAQTAAKFVLGTVQLGLAYGKLRKFAFPSAAEATAILHKAAGIGVHDFDTARNYGVAELRLGDALTSEPDPARLIVTKLDPLFHVPADAPEWAVREAVKASVYASCRALCTRHLPVLMLHIADNRFGWNEAAWRCLLEMREQGIIGKLGASLQSPEEALKLVGDPDIEHLQVPTNILDTRWHRLGIPAMLADRPDIIVHARSVFLQGVLLGDDPSQWPPKAGEAATALIAWLKKTARELGQDSVAQLVVNYLRASGWIHGLVIGIENEAQLVSNFDLFKTSPLEPEDMARIEATRPDVPDWMLDPSKW